MSCNIKMTRIYHDANCIMINEKNDSSSGDCATIINKEHHKRQKRKVQSLEPQVLNVLPITECHKNILLPTGMKAALRT